MFYKDNWLSWTYDNGQEYGPKLTAKSTFKFNFRNTITRPVKSYYEELLENARVITDTFTGPFSLLFSGGIDSEIILRVYLDLKIPLNVYIFKYENNINLPDYTRAINVCKQLNVTPIVIDFNLQKFFENDAYYYWTKSYPFETGWLTHMKMTEYLDGIPIIGSGEPFFKRVGKNPFQKYPWVFENTEKWHHCAVYHRTIGRPAITDWYEYSPEITVAYLELPYVQDLINDKIPGKMNTIDSKAHIHQAYWPGLEDRLKLTGFEGPDPSLGKLAPDFMLEFGRQYIRGKTNHTSTLYGEYELRKLIYS